MKIITAEILVKIFAPYVGVANIDMLQYDGLLEYGDLDHVFKLGIRHKAAIEVISLSNITDEHAKLLGYSNCEHFKNRSDDWQEARDLDLLRQLGYATDFATIIEDEVVCFSIEDLVELGVYKLK
jgi:hypothetical protein